ncbi:MAG: hypothetical protein V1720_03245 [bacterium]
MKKMIVLLLLILVSSISAQEETLLAEGEVVHGGFGGPVVKFTQIYDNFGLLVGGRGGWIINHGFSIGGGGYGLVNEINGNEMMNGKKMLLQFGYGGFEMEYIADWDKLVHFSITCLLGAGGVSHRNDWDDPFEGGPDHKQDAFFILEPSANIELNIVSFFRLNLGAGYRFISGVNENDLKNADFSGPSINLTFKFGKF